MLLEKERKYIIEYCQKMSRDGLSAGTSGNISIRSGDKIVISPTGADYFKLTTEMIPVIDIDGNLIEGSSLPSSENPFHLSIYKTRPDIDSVVHTHSVNATTLACLGKELPSVHYMIGFVGHKVPLVPYSTFGGEDLANDIAKAVLSFNGALLENHGVVALGNNIAIAYACAESIEFVSEVYLKSLSIGTPKILSKDQMDVVLEKFKTYGHKKVE